MLQTLKTNPRAAWIGTCVVGIICGLVSGYTFEGSNSHVWLHYAGISSFFEVLIPAAFRVLMPGFSLGIGLALYFFLLGRASAVAAVSYTAAITFGYYVAIFAGYSAYTYLGISDYFGLSTEFFALPEMLIGFLTFASIIAIASAACFQSCRNGRLFLAMIGIGFLSVSLMTVLLTVSIGVWGVDPGGGMAFVLLFLSFEGPIAAIIGYGLFVMEQNAPRHEET